MNKPRPRAPGKPLKHKIALSITSYSKQDQSEVQNMVLGMLIRDVVATNSPACCLQGHEGQCWPLPPRCCSHPSPRCLLQSSPPPNEALSSAARGCRSARRRSCRRMRPGGGRNTRCARPWRPSRAASACSAPWRPRPGAPGPAPHRRRSRVRDRKSVV